VKLFNIVVRALTETSRHAGQADILDGQGPDDLAQLGPPLSVRHRRRGPLRPPRSRATYSVRRASLPIGGILLFLHVVDE